MCSFVQHRKWNIDADYLCLDRSVCHLCSSVWILFSAYTISLGSLSCSLHVVVLHPQICSHLLSSKWKKHSCMSYSPSCSYLFLGSFRDLVSIVSFFEFFLGFSCVYLSCSAAVLVRPATLNYSNIRQWLTTAATAFCTRCMWCGTEYFRYLLVVTLFFWQIMKTIHLKNQLPTHTLGVYTR